ncbi:MAG: tetratricopeptide repeat protein [Desulforegulaceae bacterium]|nr:tetratricopeptide repeat protein [Desulforegulaceae bacterium]
MQSIKKLFSKNPLKIIFVLLFILGFVLYGNTFKAPFVFDDMHNIKDNPYVRMTKIESNYFEKLKNFPCSTRIIPNFTFSINYYFDRYDVGGYHLVNILIHIINGFLLFLIFRQTLYFSGNRTNIIPALAAFLWFVNPVHTQSVTYIVQRMTSMCAMFYFLSLFLYIKARLDFIGINQINKKQVSLFILSFLSFVCAILSKEIAATLSFFIFLYEWFFIKDLKTEWIKKNIKWVIAIFVIILAVSIYYLGDSPLKRILSGYNYRDFTLIERLLTQPRIVLFYISILFFPLPSRLNLEHHVDISTSLFDPLTTILSVLVIFILLVFAFFSAKKYRLLSFSILWFFGNLAIESSFIALELIFEHRTYLPSAFLFLSVIYYFSFFQKNKKKLIILYSVFFVVFSGFTIQRNYTWSDDLRFHRDCLEKSPEKPRVVLNMGVCHHNNQQFEKALGYYDRAIELKPDYGEAYSKKGAVLEKLGNNEESIFYIKKAIELKPDYIENYKLMGFIYNSRNQPDKAISYLETVLKKYPDYIEARMNLGNSYILKNDYNQALIQFLRVIETDPEYYMAYNNIGDVLMRMGQKEKALGYFNLALKLNPDYEKAYLNLGSIFLKEKDFKSAENYLLKALELDDQDVDILIKTGDYYFHINQFDKAESLYKKALDINSDNSYLKIQLGIIFFKSRNYEKAEEYFKKAADTSAEKYFPYYYLGLCALSKEDYSKTIFYLERAGELNPDFEQAKKKLADVYSTLNQNNKALEIYTEILLKKPDNTDLLIKKAEIYNKEKDNKNAIKNFEKAFFYDKNNEYVIENLAFLYVEDRQYENAAEKFELLKEFMKDNSLVYYNLSCVYSEAGNLEKAISNLKYAVNLGYNNKNKILNDKNLNFIKSSKEFEDIIKTISN